MSSPICRAPLCRGATCAAWAGRAAAGTGVAAQGPPPAGSGGLAITAADPNLLPALPVHVLHMHGPCPPQTRRGFVPGLTFLPARPLLCLPAPPSAFPRPETVRSTQSCKMACTIAAIAPVAVRPVASTPLKQAKNTFAARTVSNGSIAKTTAMQGERNARPCAPQQPGP